MKTTKLTKTERLAIIRFCLERGTRIKYSTMCLHRPLDLAEVESAFLEREAKNAGNVERYRKLAVDYASGKELPKHLLQWFGGIKPTQEQLDDYIKDAIAQARGDEIIRKYYQVAVNLEFISDKFLALHKSLNPRVTFGYSSNLHEECDFELTDDLRGLIISCFKDKRDGDDRASYGGVELREGDDSLWYEDLIIFRDNIEILSTVTHELMLDLILDEDDIDALKTFEGKVERNKKITSKLITN